MKLIIHLIRKRRAVSPVIAVILLIGLAVAAVAAIFIVVLPLIQTTTDLEIADAFVEYDDDYTQTRDHGVGYGKGTVILTNAGTGSVDVVSIKVYYATPFTEVWTEITDAISIQGITNNEPYTVNPLATNEELNIRFVIPPENYDNAVLYKIIVTTDDNDDLDTSKTSAVAETDMELSKDRPAISFSTATLTPSGNIRRTYDVGPTSVSDNSAIKNVTYFVYSSPGGSSIINKTITSSLWKWRWTTYNYSAEGSDNGNYYVIMTVNDYAGLSESTGQINFAIDNDYTPPTINNIYPEALKAEVGETFEIIANVIDTGSGDSDVESVFLYYKLQNATSYSAVAMTENLGNNWTVAIPIDARALEVNLTYSIKAWDKDNNKNYWNVSDLVAEDTKVPNITHNPEVEASEQQDLTIYAIVQDPGLIDTNSVKLYLRKSNDLGANATVNGQSLPSTWVSVNPISITTLSGTSWNATWNIPQPYYNITIHGFDYYISATDKYGGNTAQHGTALIPHHVNVLDLNPADFIGISASNFPSTWTENTSYPITVQISDNDPTFGRIVNGDLITYATGKVIIHYKRYNGDPGQIFNPLDITNSIHISGNSSTGALSIWYGTIPRTVFVADGNDRTDFYLTVEDQSKTIQDQHSIVPTRWPLSGFYSINVKAPGQPNVIYSEGSVGLKNNNATVQFMINNTASGVDADADATLTGIYLQVFSAGWDFTNGQPNLTQVYFTRFNGANFSYNDTFGTPHPWTNGTLITFETGYEGIVNDNNGYNLIELTFTNTSGGSIDMHNMVLNVSFTAKVGANNVPVQKLGLIATPGVEPQSTIYAPYDAGSGKYYINHWIVTPLYSYGSSGLGWDLETEEPWTGSYSRFEVSSGKVLPYHGYNIVTGSGTFTTNTWKETTNNAGYRMNIDSLTGNPSYSYMWFYAVIMFSGPDSAATMYLGSDDEAVCYINGQLAGSYGSPRSYGETTYSVSLLGNNKNNYILFGVHEDGGDYYGGLAFAGIGAFQIKIFTGPPPPPLGTQLSQKVVSEQVILHESTIKPLSMTFSDTYSLAIESRIALFAKIAIEG